MGSFIGGEGVFVDVSANTGLYNVVVASVLEKKETVIYFELVKRRYNRLT